MTISPGQLELEALVADSGETPGELAATLLDLLPAPVLGVGPSGVILACNPAAAALFGRARAGLLGLHVRELIAPGGRASLQRRVHGALSDEAAWPAGGRTFRGTGLRAGNRPFPVTVQVARTTVGDQPMVALLLTDRSEAAADGARVEAEAERRRVLAEEAFEALTVHADGVILAANPAFARLVGRALEEVVGRPVLEFAAPEVAAEVRQSLRQPAEASYETLVLRADGTRVPVAVERRPVSYRGRRANLVGTRDISDQAAWRRHLAESEERFRLLFEQSMDAILLGRPDGCIEDANDAACELFGRSRDELRSLGRTGIVDPTDVRWLEAVRVRRQAGAFIGELRFRRRDGTTFPADVVSNIFLDHEGAERSAMTVRDATARREAEDRVRQALASEQDALQRLAELNTAKSEFIAMLSHDFRTALIGISWLTDALAANAEAAQRAATSDQVRAEVHRLIRLLDEILELDRMQSGRLRLQLGAVDLEDLLAPLLAPLRAHGRSLDVRIPARLPAIKGDADRLSQVFANLLSNAQKYSSPASVIAIRATVDEGAVHVSIRNRGQAIPPGELERIFERFVRAEQPNGRQAPGSGLGLAIARNIVELHGGRIWIESRAGLGTRAHVVLPAHPNLAAKTAG